MLPIRHGGHLSQRSIGHTQSDTKRIQKITHKSTDGESAMNAH